MALVWYPKVCNMLYTVIIILLLVCHATVIVYYYHVIIILLYYCYHCHVIIIALHSCMTMLIICSNIEYLLYGGSFKIPSLDPCNKSVINKCIYTDSFHFPSFSQ